MDPLAALDIKLSGQDFTPVLLPETQVPLQITAAGIHTNKTSGKQSLFVTSCTTQPWPSIKAGEEVPAGKEFTSYYAIALPDTVDMTNAQEVAEAKRKIGLRLQNLFMAVFKCTKEDCPDLSMDSVNHMVGRQIVGKIIIERSTQFGDQNRLDVIL